MELLIFISSGWLSNSDDMTIFPSINQRLEDITGLEMDTAEELQVIPRNVISVLEIFKI